MKRAGAALCLRPVSSLKEEKHHTDRVIKQKNTGFRSENNISRMRKSPERNFTLLTGVWRVKFGNRRGGYLNVDNRHFIDLKIKKQRDRL
jgi:hypothetical protein